MRATDHSFAYGQGMDNTPETVLVRRPQRWDQPLDAAMSADDVSWLRTRNPFAAMRDDAFPRATPLRGILQHDCRIRRCARGEIIVREGDYGNSAFLVLAGGVRVSVDRLPPELLGRQTPQKQSWRSAVAQLWRRPRLAEVRSAEAVSGNANTRIDASDDNPTIFLQDFPGVFQKHRSLSLGPGELFGEVAAMYRTPQTATVVAEEEATIVEIRWQGLRLLRRDVLFAEQLEQHYRAHWLMSHLRETPLLRFMPEEALQKVADATLLRSYGRMEWNLDYRNIRRLPVAEQIEQEPLIAIEGNLPTELILIRTGFARVSQQHGSGHQTTSYLGKGHTFGFAEIAHNAFRATGTPPRALHHSLRSVGFVDTLQIPIETVAEYVLPYVRRGEIQRAAEQPVVAEIDEERRSARREKPGEYSGEVVDEPNAHIDTGLLEFLVQERLTNGRQTMVIDLERCTRCDDCVKACATTHDGNPRMTRSGPIHDSLMFAQACMHCTDPVCMIGCPTGALARDEANGTVRVEEPICIGCGTCASACPYENISMVEIQDAEGRAYQDAGSGLPILKATKCDLCQTQPAGPACLNACPHDALARLDLSHLGPLDAWLGRRRG